MYVVCTLHQQVIRCSNACKHANMLVKKQLQLIKYYRPSQHCRERCYRKNSEGNSSVGIAYRGLE